MNRTSKFVVALAGCSTLADAQVTWRASAGADGRQANGDSRVDALQVFTDDARQLVFSSLATNLVAGDTNGTDDVFVRDLATGAIERVSVSTNGTQVNFGAYGGSISPDGRYVTFSTSATNLVSGDNNAYVDVFLRDRVAGTTERVSVGTGGFESDGGGSRASLSSDARHVVFESQATNLAPNDINGSFDIFVRDRALGLTELVSASTSGVPGDRESVFAMLSGDGRVVVFQSLAADLVANDTNGVTDIFARDRLLGTTERVSRSSAGAQADSDSYQPSISADGRFVAFWSVAANLVGDDANGSLDVFVHDRTLGTTQLVSRTPTGAPGGGGSSDPFLSSDGGWVVFRSSATDLDPADTNGSEDLFVRELSTGLTRLVTRTSAGVPLSYFSGDLSIARGGVRSAWWTHDDRLVPGDTNQREDVFVCELNTGASVRAYGSAKQNSLLCSPSIGANGLPSLSGAATFDLIATRVLNQQPGIYFWGLAPAAISFGGGTRLVASPLRRTNVSSSGGSTGAPACAGEQLFRFDGAFLGAHGIGIGQTVYVQCWTRDPGFSPPDDIGLTDALAITVGG